VNNRQSVEKLAKESGIVFVGTTIGYILRYGILIFIARAFSASTVGIYSLGLTLTTISANIARLGLPTATVRFTSEFRASNSHQKIYSLFRFSLVIAGISAVLVALIQFGFADQWMGLMSRKSDNGVIQIDVIRLFALTVPLSVITNVALAITQGYKVMKYRAIVLNFIQPLMMFFALMVLLQFNWVEQSIWFAFVASYITTTFCAFYFSYRFGSIFQPGEPIDKTEVMRFAIPAMLSSTLTMFVMMADVWVIRYYLGTEEAGFYYPAARTSILIHTILFAFMSIFSPIVSELVKRKDFSALEKQFKLATKWMLHLAVPAMLFLGVAGQDVLHIFGAKYVHHSLHTLWLLNIGRFITVAVGPVGMMILMSGRAKLDLWNNLIATIVFFLVAVVLMKFNRSITSIAWAVLISRAVLSVLRAIEVRKIFRMTAYQISNLKPFFSGLVAMIITYFWIQGEILDDFKFRVISAAILFLIAYLAVLKLCGFDDDDEMVFEALRKKIKTMYLVSRSDN